MTRAYDSSRLYRDLKLRGAIIAERELKLLPLEQMYSKALGVMNLSSDQARSSRAAMCMYVCVCVRVQWKRGRAGGR